MRNKQMTFALILVVLTVSSLVSWQMVWKVKPEPVYQGKGLSAWLAGYEQHLLDWHLGARTNAAVADAEAVQKMGTNAIPALLRMLRARDSALHSRLITLWQKPVMRTPWLPSWVRRPIWVRNPARVENELAVTGFTILGGNAQQAVPALIEIYEKNLSSSSQWAASRALIGIGPAVRNATPIFLRAATNQDPAMRESAVAALVNMKVEPGLLVPVLMNAIGDRRWSVRGQAAEGLARLGPTARPAVPTLVQALNDTNGYVRRLVTYALKQIDPVAAASAGINTNSLGM